MQLGADFVQMWTGTTASSGTCGIGYVPVDMRSVPPLTSIVNSICFDGLTVAHEVGEAVAARAGYSNELQIRATAATAGSCRGVSLAFALER
jgi:hypothetical protein